MSQTKNLYKKEYDYKQLYIDNQNLYLGDAHLVFQTNKIKAKTDESQQYLSYNIFSQITDTYSNLILEENPKITLGDGKNQDDFENLAKKISLWSKVSEIFETMSYAGDCPVYLNFDKNQNPEIVVLPNTSWTPHINESRPDLEAEKHSITHSFNISNVEYIVYQDFTEDMITFRCYQGDDEEVLTKFPEEIVEKLGIEDYTENEDFTLSKEIGYPLFFRFFNRKITGKYFGISDYSQSIKNKSKSMNDILALSEKVLIETGDPIKLLPESLIKQTIKEINDSSEVAGVFGLEREREAGIFKNTSNEEFFDGVSLQSTLVANKIVQKSKILPVSMSDQKPEYIEYEAHIEKMEMLFNQLKRLCYYEARLNPTIFEESIQTGNLSGVALERLMKDTIAKAKAKITNFEAVFRKMLKSLFKMADINYDEEIKIEWSIGIVESNLEKLERIERLVANRFISQKDAVKEINGYTEEEAEEKIEEIDLEEGNPNLA